MKEAEGYFTVEAALVMPVVFACYLIIGVIMCYVYDRCVLEENAWRVSVWKAYTEGYWGEDKTTDFLAHYLVEEEKNGLLLAKDGEAVIRIKGDTISVERKFKCFDDTDKEDTFFAESVSPDPVDYIRMINRVKDAVSDEKDVWESKGCV